jgi:hypothetical protein
MVKNKTMEKIWKIKQNGKSYSQVLPIYTLRLNSNKKNLFIREKEVVQGHVLDHVDARATRGHNPDLDLEDAIAIVDIGAAVVAIVVVITVEDDPTLDQDLALTRVLDQDRIVEIEEAIVKVGIENVATDLDLVLKAEQQNQTIIRLLLVLDRHGLEHQVDQDQNQIQDLKEVKVNRYPHRIVKAKTVKNLHRLHLRRLHQHLCLVIKARPTKALWWKQMDM